MRKRIVTTLALLTFLMGVASLPRAVAQEAAKENAAPINPSESYKIDFTVNEIENGKKINSRSYQMLLRAEAAPKWSDKQELRVGSRVPVDLGPGPGSIQYEDVGMNLDCRLMPIANGKVILDTSWAYSALENEHGPGSDTQRPVFHQVKSGGQAVVPLDKPTVITEMDDVASSHRYVFEVKVTKVSE